MECTNCPVEKMTASALKAVERNPRSVLTTTERREITKRLVIKSELIAIATEDCSGMTAEDAECPQLDVINGSFENVFPPEKTTTVNQKSLDDTDNN